MKIDLFVPGRLCLFGEHSDWAGRYRTMNSEIVPGEAIVTGIEQGIYATVELCPTFRMSSEAPEISSIWKDFECNMDLQELRDIARSSNFFSYSAGVASYMLEWYKVGGVHVHITKMDMPIKSGLSSSAAICVLVARAFNRLYRLNLSTRGEMNIAYWGELRTASRCGRLDQACAFGSRPVRMTFDAEDIEVKLFNIHQPLYWVFANLNAAKDTVRILSDLNRAYPFAANDAERKAHEALGRINREIVDNAMDYMSSGDVTALGALMCEAQEIFDRDVAPLCPDQLKAPLLHATLSDPKVKSLTYGGKGVGSQGDGSVQFLAKDEACQQELTAYLNSKGMSAYSFTIGARYSVRKAIIPVAGFGTRLYPQTRILKKDFFPIVDSDNYVKPLILILLEECVNAGIENICIVLGSEEEREDYRRFFETPLSEEHLSKLPDDKRRYEEHILEIGKKLTFVYQNEKKGFGDAVYLCREFAADEPVLLLLGDTIYKSNSGKNCAAQMIEAYEKFNMALVSVHEIPVEKVSSYGIIKGRWIDSREKLMMIGQMCEKPSVAYAQENLGVKYRSGRQGYFSVFGQYVLTPEIFAQLGENIRNGVVNSKGEVELTTALDQVRASEGVIGIRLDGRMYDMGIPDELRNTVANYGKENN